MHHSDWSERPCRWKAEHEGGAFWVPDRSEIVIQYFTRYLFFPLSVVYFEQIDARIEAWSRSNAPPLAVNLGVAQAPQHGHDLVTLLSVADIHLYQSKSRQPVQAGVPAFFRTAIDEPQVT